MVENISVVHMMAYKCADVTQNSDVEKCQTEGFD